MRRGSAAPGSRTISRRAWSRPRSSRNPGGSLSIGFYETYEEASYPALKRALPHLDWVIPNWLGLHGPNLDLKPAIDKRVINLVRANRPSASIVPMVQNIEKGVWTAKAWRRCSPMPSGARGS